MLNIFLDIVCVCARMRARVSSIQWWLVSNQNLQICLLI